jgi:hypothetical protein
LLEEKIKMPSTTKKLTEKGLIKPPEWLPDNVHYEVITGSVSYGVSGDTSDMDVIGFCVPKKEIVFPHLAGEILDFGRQKKRFGQFLQHDIDCPDELGGKGRNYDVTIYNIVKYFNLCMENNPNMIDSLFVPTDCVLHITQIGNMVRDARKLFLHKGCWQKFKGYAYSMLHKADVKNYERLQPIKKFEKEKGLSNEIKFNEVEEEMKKRELSPFVEKKQLKIKKNTNLSLLTNIELQQYYLLYHKITQESKRAEGVKITGFDTKFLYHVARLLDECEQILTLGDLDLRRSREYMKAIRKGEVKPEDVKQWFTEKEKQLEELYNRENSPIPYSPDENKIKQLLLDCLEHHYGNLSACVVIPDAASRTLQDIQELLNQYNLEIRKNN